MKRFERQELSAHKHAKFFEQRTVRFQDVDAAGVIFYARGFEYLHDAYVSFLTFSGVHLPDVLQSGSWAAPIGHAEIDYFRPLRFGDEIHVALVCAHVDGSRVTLGYRIDLSQTGEVAAVGQTVHTFVDPKRFERVPIPEKLRIAFESLNDLGSAPAADQRLA